MRLPTSATTLGSVGDLGANSWRLIAAAAAAASADDAVSEVFDGIAAGAAASQARFPRSLQ